VLDASGLIATSYHVIEGAKAATVVFPADKNKKSFNVEGFVGILPTKDLALIRIQPGDKKLSVCVWRTTSRRKANGCSRSAHRWA